MSKDRIQLVRGDITEVEADAIVNAANKTLLGGGGVDGAIHRAAGPGLYEECVALKGCEVGDAKITSGHNLKAKYVIHTVGPVWRNGLNDEFEKLASCYQNCLRLAKENKVRTIAFPGISTGVYGFPKEQAALVAITESRRILKKNKLPEKVIFVAFDEENYNVYNRLLNNNE